MCRQTTSVGKNAEFGARNGAGVFVAYSILRIPHSEFRIGCGQKPLWETVMRFFDLFTIIFAQLLNFIFGLLGAIIGV